MKYEDAVKYISEIYNYYMAYCGFSKIHLIIFVTFLLIVIGAVNIGVKKYSDKQDLITWLREK